MSRVSAPFISPLSATLPMYRICVRRQVVAAHDHSNLIMPVCLLFIVFRADVGHAVGVFADFRRQ
jgi:hypothetical protein